MLRVGVRARIGLEVGLELRSDQRACPGGARQKGEVDSSRQYSAAFSLCAPPCCSRIARSSW